MLSNNNNTSATPSSSSEPFPTLDDGSNSKRKRRPAGTPDPDAEVVSLSPKTLLESDRYVCEICNQGFQRDQNLQMHRRRHKVPWKLLKRETPAVRKRVFVCPEPTCLHHDPCHALGDLVGIKKHFRRKHSSHKQWVCDKCSKAYAVQSDFKAHLKTCGTRGHSCDCGRVFSRVESFIEHQDACSMGRIGRPESQPHVKPTAAPCLSRTASSASPSSDTNLSAAASCWPGLLMPSSHNNPAGTTTAPMNILGASSNNFYNARDKHNLELQLLTTATATATMSGSTPTRRGLLDVPATSNEGEDDSTPSQLLQLSIGSSSSSSDAGRLRVAMAEKAYAEEARKEARREIETAEREFANAKRIRQQAREDMEKAVALREHAIRQINSTLSQITCRACKLKLQPASQLN
ncbi:unnamed protein product [Cuscuta epithymum]|uniref:C2H2-type domain-containing protein n=1 Tax=Cuscuta epithymum TaxID=186058 RepID=A0AAV0EBM6_9ASTE|nr:unnamed protein product [Cuscuta epithymum]